MTSSITVREVSELANSLTAENIEAAVAALDPADVPVYLARLTDAAGRNRVLTKALERRLQADGKTGDHFTVDGLEYGFFGSLQRGWKDIPGLIGNLLKLGLSTREVSQAISEIRVTDLRDVAAQLSDPEKRAAALELIEGNRIPKGERGEPRFQLVDEKYVTK